MLEPPEILQTSARPAAVIRLTIPRAEIQNVMGPESGLDPTRPRSELNRPLVG